LELCITPSVRVPTKVNTPTQEKLGWGTRQQRLVSTAQRWIHLAQHGPAKEKSALESLDGYILGLLGAKTDIPT
jgi:hypothetical protein